MWYISKTPKSAEHWIPNATWDPGKTIANSGHWYVPLQCIHLYVNYWLLFQIPSYTEIKWVLQHGEKYLVNKESQTEWSATKAAISAQRYLRSSWKNGDVPSHITFKISTIKWLRRTLRAANEISHQEGYIEQPRHWHGIIVPPRNSDRPYSPIISETPIEQRTGDKHSSKMCQPLQAKRRNISPIVPKTTWILWPAHKRSLQSSDRARVLNKDGCIWTLIVHQEWETNSRPDDPSQYAPYETHAFENQIQATTNNQIQVTKIQRIRTLIHFVLTFPVSFS